MDRRALFFVGAAVVCLVLTPATPSDLRWFALVLAGVYLVLAAASALDNRSRRRQPPRR
jgi:threonine/homoserine efflux transporter RhtA